MASTKPNLCLVKEKYGEPEEVDPAQERTHDDSMSPPNEELKDSINDLKVASADLRASVREGIADMKVREASMDANFARFQETLNSGMANMRADLAGMKGDLSEKIARSEVSSTRWFVAILVTAAIGVAGLFLRGTAISAQQSLPPPVIVVPPYQPPAPAAIPPTTSPPAAQPNPQRPQG